MVVNKRGDVLSASADLICHQTNCKGSMGAGIAKQIKLRYPEVNEAYVALCRSLGDSALGEIQCIPCRDGKTICNVFGQVSYSRSGCNTDYKALRKCFEKIASMPVKSIAIPYRIGCGLGGGNWDIVYSMICELFGTSQIECQVWQLIE